MLPIAGQCTAHEGTYCFKNSLFLHIYAWLKLIKSTEDDNVNYGKNSTERQRDHYFNTMTKVWTWCPFISPLWATKTNFLHRQVSTLSSCWIFLWNPPSKKHFYVTKLFSLFFYSLQGLKMAVQNTKQSNQTKLRSVTPTVRKCNY